MKCAYTGPIDGLTNTCTSQNTVHKKRFNVNILCTQEINGEFIIENWNVYFNIEKTLYYVPKWTWWLSHTVIQHFFHSYLTIHYMDMTAPHKQNQEHRLRHSHTTHCIQMWVTHLRIEIRNCLPSMLTHGPLYFIHTTHIYTRNSFPATPLNDNY